MSCFIIITSIVNVFMELSNIWQRTQLPYITDIFKEYTRNRLAYNNIYTEIRQYWNSVVSKNDK
jgi:hypothetical protein